MTRRIFITPKANQDLDDLFNYLNQNNPDAALRFFVLPAKLSPNSHKLQV